MTPAAILSGEIVAAERALDRANRSLDSLGEAAGSALLKRVRGRFNNNIKVNLNKCRSLRQRIQQGASVEAGWSELRNLQLEISDLLSECLAFVEGALARKYEFDGGICALADKMLDELSSQADLGWQRFTLVAAGEFYSSLSGIVRLRFTDTDVWSLPVCVHEFGHFVAATRTFAEFEGIAAREKQNDSRYDSHLRELFSDMFATYALGPSLAMACALLRFVPSFEESKTHPSNAQRIWCMLQTLEKMSDDEDESLKDIAAKIAVSWSGALKVSSPLGILSEEEQARLRPWFLELYDVIEAHVPALRYRSIQRAQQMYYGFREQLRRFAPLEAPTLSDVEIPEILNAVWLYRLNTESFNAAELDAVAGLAFKMCESIANRG